MTKTLLCEAPTIGSVYTTLDGLPVRRVVVVEDGTPMGARSR